MIKTHRLLSAIALLLAVGLGLYATDLWRQARDRRKVAAQQHDAERQRQFEEMKERRSNLNIRLGSNERAIEVFCRSDHKKAKPTDAAFNKQECEILQETHRQVVREIAETDQEIKEWLAAKTATPVNRH